MGNMKPLLTLLVTVIVAMAAYDAVVGPLISSTATKKGTR